MRFVAAIAILSALPPLLAADKLTFQDRVELMRGLMAEYAKAKVLVPRSKKNLEVNADGSYDKREWQTIAKATAWKDYAEHNDTCKALITAAQKLL